MTKISFDVDFSKDPEKILQEIQERAKAEVEKRENKERNAAFLSKLHETVNEKIGTDFKSVSDLIKALTPFAAPSLREKLSGTTASGRRKTISMNKEIYDEVKKSLRESNPNKAAIARKSGISVVQVRKIADGGYDKKFAGSSSSPNQTSPKAPQPSSSVKPPAIDEKKDEVDEENSLPSPTFEDNATEKPELPPINFDSDPEPESAPLPSPSFADDHATDLPPPAPAPEPPVIEDSAGADDSADESSVPPLPSFAPLSPPKPEESKSLTDTEELPPPPSFGDEDASDTALPPVDLSPPPAPDLPTPPPSLGEDTSSPDEILPPIEEIPEPVFDTPPAPPVADEAESSQDLNPLPSFGDDAEDTTPPPPTLSDLVPPPEPEIPLPAPAEPVFDTPPLSDLPPPAPEEPAPEPIAAEEPPAPPIPDASPAVHEEPPAPAPAKPSGPGKLGLTRPPSGGLKPTLKPKLGVGKKGKPSLSLKPKSKTSGLKITRPPMGGKPPPSQ
jgi:hypothetical protein